MNQVIEKLAADGHLTNQQVADIQKRAAEFKLAMELDPSLKKEATQKLAGWFGAAEEAVAHPGLMSDFGSVLRRSLAPTLANVAMAAGLGIGEKLVREGYNAIRGSLEKGKSYKAMLDEHPDLKQEDAKKVQARFDTLYRMSPDIARDPVSAGGAVKQMIGYGGLGVGDIKDLVDIQQKITGTHEKGQLFDPTRMTQVAPSAHPTQIALWQAQLAREQAQAHDISGMHPLRHQQMAQEISMHPLERQRLEQQIATHPVEHGIKEHERTLKGRDVELMPLEEDTRKLKYDVLEQQLENMRHPPKNP